MAGDMSLGKLKISVGLDGKGVTEGVSKLERDIKGGVKNFSSFSAATRRGGQELEITKAKVGMLGNSVQNMSKITQSYADVLNDSSKMSRLTEGEQAKLRQEYEQSAVKLNAYKQQFVDTSREMAEMQVKTQGWTGALNSAGETLTSVGSSMTKGITLPMAAVGTMALKVGFDFEEGMSRVKAISGATSEEMEQLTAQARQLGKDTAFSARETAQGMENLAMAGFSVNEIMQAAPGLLDLAAVSGRDVGLAAEISAGTLRSFGLEASEAGRVADVLAKTATSAATDTSDLGEAMKYIAPVAHQLGLSVEETSAAIGVMANHSIKGSQAGTTMRMALTRMAKPTGEAADLMEELGITYFDAQGKMKPFGNILNELQTSMKDLSDEQRAAALKTLFGQTALSGMMALVGEAPGVYDNFTESLNNSAGAADEMARTMQDNANNSIEQMMGSLEDAGIAIARIVTPAFRDITKFIEQCADAFSDLDPEAQKIIVKLGLLAMAAGPTAMVLGKVTTGAISMAAAFKGAQAAKGAAATVELLGKTASSSAVGMGTLGAGAGKAFGAIGMMNPVVLGTVGVVSALGITLGLTAKAFSDHRYATRWGDGVSESSAKALDGVKTAQDGITVALGQTETDGKQASKEVSDAFTSMAEDVSKNVQNANKEMQDAFNSLPKDLQNVVSKAHNEFKKENAEIEKEAKLLANKIKNIESQSGKETLEQQTFLHESRLKMNELSVKSLNLTSEQEKEALKKLNGDVLTMTNEQRYKSLDSITETTAKTIEKYDEQRKAIDTYYKQGGISAKEHQNILKSLDVQQEDANKNMIARAYELMKANGDSEIEMRMRFDKMGTTLEKAKSAYDELGNAANKNMSAMIGSTEKMDKKTKESVDKWNGLVLDEKTGKLKSNAVEEVAKAMESKDEWNSMKLAAKEANVGSNARKIFTEAAIQSGKWNSMKLEEKKATVNSDVAKRLLDDKDAMIEFNTLTIPEKKIVMSSNSAETVEKSLRSAGMWDDFNPKLKKLIAETNAPIVVNDSLIELEGWDKLDPKVKKLLVENFASKNFEDAIKSQEDWDAIPPTIKELIVNNENAKQALAEAGIKIDGYNSNANPMLKELRGDASGVVNASNTGMSAIAAMNGTKVNDKSIDASWDGQHAITTAKNQLNDLTANPYIVKVFTETSEKRAGGDPYFKGGPVTVNDQKGSSYRELIRLPNGREMLPSGRDVEMNLPTGTRIFNANETNQIMAERREMSRLASYNEVGQYSSLGASDGNVSNLLSQLNRTSGAGMSAIERTARAILRAMEQQSGKDLFGSNSYEKMARDERNRSAQTL